MKTTWFKFQKIDNSLVVYRFEKEGKVKVLLSILFLACLYSLSMRFSWFMLLLLIPALYFLLTEPISILNAATQQIKRGRVFRNSANGAWQPLPPIAYVSVFRCTMVSTTHSITYRSIRHAQKVLVVNLVHHKTKKIRVYQTSNIDESFQIARQIANELQVPLLDATNRTHQWIIV